MENNRDRKVDPRPIGVFDSGVGGLTVLAALTRRLPAESFLYLGDTARVPYGIKSARTVERYTLQVADFLAKRGVKALVVACNTASALGLPALRAQRPIFAVGVIRAGCRALVASCRGGRVGVIGTRATIASGAYPLALAEVDPQAQVVSLACPLFVPLVEEGWLDHPATRMIIADTLRPLVDHPPDALILGCTHYPPLKPLIRSVLGAGTQLIDSAESLALLLENHLQAGIIAPAPSDRQGETHLMVTDVADRFRDVAARFLGEPPQGEVEVVDL